MVVRETRTHVPPLKHEAPETKALAKEVTGMKMSKEYLGDAVYATHDGFAVTLTTEDGVDTTNTIVLEPQVVAALEDFLDRVRTKP